MKYTFSSSPWGFRFMPLSEYCRIMNTLGINQLSLMFGNPSQFPLALERDRNQFESYRKIIHANQCRILEIAIDSGNIGDVAMAVELGAQFIRICEDWENTPEMFDKTVSRLKLISRAAGNATVIVENHDGLLCGIEQCKRFFDAVDAQNVKLNFDAANFFYFAEVDPLTALKELGGVIGFYHLKNVNSSHEFCRISEGVIHYPELMRSIIALSGDSAVFCLEYENPDDPEDGTRDDLAAIKQLLK